MIMQFWYGLVLLHFGACFDPLPPPQITDPTLQPSHPGVSSDSTQSGKCSLFNTSLPCIAGSECLPKTACLFPSTPKGRDYYCPCTQGQCANCLNQTVCLNQTGCDWNGISCYNDCNHGPCSMCLNDYSCNGHMSHNCFWANYTNNFTGSCEPIACQPGVCHCSTESACSALAECQWTPDGRCTSNTCASNPMNSSCLVDQAFASASRTVPPQPDSKCVNPYYPWDFYWPDDEAPTNCETGQCALCQLGRYCPTGSTNPHLLLTVCESNYYCPNASVQIECPAGYYCPAHSVEPVECSIGLYCPVNLTGQPTWCQKGYYCATPAQIAICPAGYYCLQGLAVPIPCPFASTCDEGSYEPNRGAVLGLTLTSLCIIVLGFVGIIYFRYTVNRRQATKHIQQRDTRSMAINSFVSVVNVMKGEEMTFKGFERHTNPPCTIEFEELSLKVGEKVILEGVSGAFPHSSLVAIMGPSGAGKTSFLNVLTGKAHYGEVGGKATMNTHQPNAKSIRHEVGFVPQDDIVHDILTVRDNIAWSAWLRLPAEWTNAHKTDIIDDVISLLGLTPIQHSVVGSVEKRGISGGQRKRVNIGMELAADPTVLFLDEPTSGLDASTTQEILQRLREFSRLGISTAAVIHQPRYSAFLAFDYILLLGVGGRTVYLGTSQGALSYFQSIGFSCPPRENPADYFLDVISGLIPCETQKTFQPQDLFQLWISRTWKDEGHSLVKQDTREALWDEFKKFDKNGDNKIDVDELMTFFQSVGLKMDRQKCVDLFFRKAHKKALEVRLQRESSAPPVTNRRTANESTSEVKEMDMIPGSMEGGEMEMTSVSAKTDVMSRIANDMAPESPATTTTTTTTTATTTATETSTTTTTSATTSTTTSTGGEDDSGWITLDELVAVVNAPRDLTASTEKIVIRKVPNFFYQFAYFFMRDCVRIYRESAGVLANCFLQALVGTMLGLLYGGDWALYKLPEISLALATFACLFGGLLSINLLAPERLVNYREAAAGTNQHAYFLNKLLLNLLYCILHTTSLLLVFYPLINFPFGYKLLWSWVFLCFFVASGFGMLLAVIHRGPHVVVGIVLTVINLFLSGALVTLKDLGSAAPITYISPARWLATLILSYTLHSLPSQWDSTRISLENQFEFYYADRTKAVTALVVMGLILRVMAYIAHFLWERNKK